MLYKKGEEQFKKTYNLYVLTIIAIDPEDQYSLEKTRSNTRIVPG